MEYTVSKSVLVTCILWICSVSNAQDTDVPDPIATLPHGGLLRGITTTLGDQLVDMFLGIRYAKAPVGDLRFSKPTEPERWVGIQEVKQTMSECPQLGLDGEITGNEDCLFLHVYRPSTRNDPPPRRGQPPIRRSVMVYIHGGGFDSGSGTPYIGAPLAITGDVLVVTINYRLGALGFLSSGVGTGNYGLWDQEAALRWIKKNIAQFGGDPSKITIFGQSAGAKSVAAHMMREDNDNLFIRAIQQSGSLYSWWHQLNGERIEKRNEEIREKAGCGERESIVDCLKPLTVENLFNVTSGLNLTRWGPTVDEDFFPSTITDEDYTPTQRYDFLAGYTGQEAVGYIPSLSGYQDMQRTTSGVTSNYTEGLGREICEMDMPLGADMCTQLFIQNYRILHAQSDAYRAIRLSHMIGEYTFNVDMLRQLEKHSEGNRSTYGYYFDQKLSSTDLFRPGPNNVPGWLKVSAEHSEEIPMVWGAPALLGDRNKLWADILSNSSSISPAALTTRYTAAEGRFSDLLMTMWTNFAKSGNPNEPTQLQVPRGTSSWPTFTAYNQLLMKLEMSQLGSVYTPNKHRMDRTRQYFFNSRRLQFLASNKVC